MTSTPSDANAEKPRAAYHERFNGAKENAEQPAPKRVRKVVSGPVVRRKTPLSRRIVETFTGDDAQTVGGYVLFEVVIPALKTLLSDVASQGVERLLFGEVRPRSSSPYRHAPRTNYDRMYSSGSYRREEPRRSSPPPRSRSSQDTGEIILRSRSDAEDVLEALSSLLDQYDVATVADLYELVGITGSFTDDKWGWTDLRGTRIVREHQGYLLLLPRPQAID